MKPISQHIHESLQDNKEVKETIVKPRNEEGTTEIRELIPSLIHLNSKKIFPKCIVLK